MRDPEPHRTELARTLLPLVHEVAGRVARRLPAHVLLDDLVGAGMLGLARALDRYDPRRAQTFRAYAELRIRGEIMDELRRSDLLSRDARCGCKRLERATSTVANRLGRTPSADQVARQLDISLDEYHALRTRYAGARFVPAESAGLAEETTPVDLIAERELLDELTTAIARLPERLRVILWLYYVEELPLREIGDLLGVTPSRVCQLRAEAVQLLRGSTLALAA
jgi:RNA polymerase sigma factor for flagellar operon FliA